MLSLTGDASQYGDDIKKGIGLAVEEINSADGIRGRQIKIIYEDGQASPTPSVSAIQKLITMDKVPLVIGEVASSPTLAMATIAEQSKVVLISPTASSPELTTAGEYILRNWPSDNYEGGVMADFAYKKLVSGTWRFFSSITTTGSASKRYSETNSRISVAT